MGERLRSGNPDEDRASRLKGRGTHGAGSRWRRASTVAGLALLLALLMGCGAANGASEEGSGVKVELLRADSPLRAPTWVPKEDVLLALSEDGKRLVRLDPAAGTRPAEGTGRPAVVRSRSLEGAAGENLAPDPRKLNDVYVPLPSEDRALLVDADTLKTKGDLSVGKAPEWAAVHPGSKSLFALSEDGSTVTGVDLGSGKRVFDVGVGGDGGSSLEVPEKGIEPAFYVVGPGGVEFFSGSPPERQVGKKIAVEEEAFTLDDDASERVYIGEPSGRVDLIEGDPQDELKGKLLIEKRADLGEPAEFLESRIAEEMLVYAVTESKVVAIKYDTMQVVGSVDFRRPLKQKALEDAKVSGMTVGEKRVYLTLKGEPYVLSVEKPS